MLDASHATDAAFAVSYPAKRILILGDTSNARIAGGRIVEAAGAGVSAMLPIAGAVEQLRNIHGVAAILTEVAETSGDDLLPLLDALEAEARRGRPSVIVVPRTLLDLAAARAGHPGIQILCEPEPLERAAAIGLALAGVATRLHDIGGDGGSGRLRQLSEEVSRIARTLASLSSESTARPGLRGSAMLDGLLPGVVTDVRDVEPATIRAIIRARRLRDQYFDRELFADPAWDILLDLAAARLERVPVAVSSLCIAAAVPPTTALRWIKTLTDAGLLVRAADTRDGRRVFIELSEQAAAGMMAYLQAITKLGTLLT